ncbi:MAG: hypothetical protein LBP39_02395 [Rickettsiales bacterium]|nr:hypothetical protein [Rickettsiales bacterium]
MFCIPGGEKHRGSETMSPVGEGRGAEEKYEIFVIAFLLRSGMMLALIIVNNMKYGKIMRSKYVILAAAAVILLFTATPRVNLIKKIDSKYTQIKVKNIKEYLRQNEGRMLDSCLSTEENLKDYKAL